MNGNRTSIARRCALFGVALAVLALTVGSPASAAPKKTAMDTPQLSCGAATSTSIQVIVCARATGAPAGFSLHWLSLADFLAGGSIWPSSDLMCHASFSGNANNSSYSLGANGCVAVELGDNLFDDPGASSNCASVPLECGTDYAIRGFAHANSALQRSAFTSTLVCSTQPCVPPPGCTYTQGYWKTHGPIPTGNNVNEWPVTSLTLGTAVYTDLELQAIFDTPAAGNGLISLAHQLIAAKLNVANGTDDSAIAGAIAAADALIGGLVVPPVGAGSLPSSATSSLTGTLTSYNEGTIGPGHCEG